MSLIKSIKVFMLVTLAFYSTSPINSSEYLEEESIEELVEIDVEHQASNNDNIMCRNEITGESLDW
jgi:hypothetical protein